MRSFVLALVALVGINLYAGTDVQFQAHVPLNGTSVSFSAYIADSTFNENSHLNSSALWYVENKTVQVSNGIINTLLENIPDSVFAGNQGKIFVYSYVNGVSLGKLPLHKLPYSVFADYSETSKIADVAKFAQDAKFAEQSDTAWYSIESKHSVKADTSTFSVGSARSKFSDTATFARNAGHSASADAALLSQEARHSNLSDTALYAKNAGNSATTNLVNQNGVNTLSIQNGAVVTEKIADGAITSAKLGVDAVQNVHMADNSVTLDNIAGNSTAAVGSYLTKGVSGLSWEVNPQHRTTSVSIHTVAPATLPNTSRWIVSRVAVDYNLVTITNPTFGQLVTVYNGSTANNITLLATTWNIDTGLNLSIWAGQSHTLWYNGINWVVVE